MSRKPFAKMIFFALALMIAGGTGVFAQGEACGLRIEVARDDNDAAISGATATAVNLENKKIYRSTLRRGMPFFAALSQGEYKITVSKIGYKKSVSQYVVNCPPTANATLSTSIPMWEGSAREVVSVDEEYQATEPLPLRSSPVDATQYNVAPDAVNGGVLNGKASNLVKPAYPAAAKAVRAEGAVNVQVTIDENGNVISAVAVSGHPLLRAASVKAARESTFAPTRLEGVPVKVTGIIVYNFVP